MKPKKEFWTCVIGPADRNQLPDGADFPLRMAVQTAFENLTENPYEICMSGWGNDSKKAALAEMKRNLVYAVEKVNTPEAELRKLTSGELLRLLTNFAKDYSKEGVKSVRQNSHMNQVNIKKDVNQKVVDATLVDFINFIAGQYGVDYGLYTKDLKDPKQDVEFSI